LRHNGFRDHPIRPLSHPSMFFAKEWIIVVCE